MFTGIIETLGTVAGVRKSGDFCTIEIQPHKILEKVAIGDSIAVNGVCLTVKQYKADSFIFDIMAETINKTTLKEVNIGARVNMERAVTLRTRLGGHMVAGHVDCIGIVQEKVYHSHNSWLLKIKLNRELMKYIAAQGSITLDGISLTVVDTYIDAFTVSTIPHTIENTTLADKNAGAQLNIEVDLMARYVVNYLQKKESENTNNINWNTIAQTGF